PLSIAAPGANDQGHRHLCADCLHAPRALTRGQVGTIRLRNRRRKSRIMRSDNHELCYSFAMALLWLCYGFAMALLFFARLRPVRSIRRQDHSNHHGDMRRTRVDVCDRMSPRLITAPITCCGLTGFPGADKLRPTWVDVERRRRATPDPRPATVNRAPS